MALSAFMRAWGWLVLIVLIVAIIGARIALRSERCAFAGTRSCCACR